MPKFRVTFVADIYLDVDAEDSDDAMQKAYEELTCLPMTHFNWNRSVNIIDWGENR